MPIQVEERTRTGAVEGTWRMEDPDVGHPRGSIPVCSGRFGI